MTHTIKRRRYAFQLPLLEGSLPPAPEAAVWVPHNNSHVTMFHVGRFEDLSDEVCSLTSLAPSIFEERFDRFVESAISLSEISYEANLKEVRSWCHASVSYAVVLIEPSSKMVSLHQKLVDLFLIFLASCQVEDPVGFMRSSKAVSYIDPWTPHITLASAHGEASIKIEPIHSSVTFGALVPHS